MKKTKILVAIDFNNQDNQNFYNCIKHNSIKLNFNKFKNENTIDNLERYIENIIVKKKITHVLIQSFLWFDYRMLLRIKNKYGVYLILLSGDCNYLYKAINIHIAHIFDLIFTAEKRFEKIYSSLNINSKHFIYPKIINKKNYVKRYDVSFVGNTIGKYKRKFYLDFLKKFEKKYKLKIVTDKFVSQKTLLNIIRKSKISLNFTGATDYLLTNFFSEKKNSFKNRALDILAQKTFCLSEYDTDTYNQLKTGKGIIYFSNEKDLITKIEYYLKNPKIREEIRNNFNTTYLKKYNINLYTKTFFSSLKNIKKNKKVYLKDSWFLKFYRFIFYIKRLLKFKSIEEIAYLQKMIILNFIR